MEYTCKICGEKISSRLMGKHMMEKHHINTKEYYDEYIKKPGEGYCLECGVETDFICLSQGYRKFCCRECSSKSPLKYEKSKQTKMDRYGNPNYNNMEKNKKTCLERYGVTHIGLSDEIKTKVKKTWDSKGEREIMEFRKKHSDIWKHKTPNEKQEIVNKVRKTKHKRYGDPNYNNTEKNKKTCLEKYGVDNVFKSEEIKDKIKQTCVKKFGVEHPAQNPEVFQKMIDTNLEKYGKLYHQQTEEFKKNNSKKRIDKTIEGNDNIIEYNIEGTEIIYKYKCPHPDCQLCESKFFKSTAGHYTVRKNQGTEVCTNILPIQYDKNTGTSLEIFIRNILDRLNIGYETNNRTVLSGKELDIYIPEKKLAIECNGVYWHSLKEPSFHYEKWKLCKNDDIQLITIWEDQIINKPEIIKGLIASKLGYFDTRIQARQCTFREVSSKEAIRFLEINHLQGSINGSIRIGLYYKNELVSLMVFGKCRKSLGSDASKDKYELYRFCNKLGVCIVGGSTRLFKHFLKKYPGCVVESFSSNDISMGNLYIRLGFEFMGEQKGSYWYIDRKFQRYHRYSFRKDELVKKYKANPTKTEFQITNEMGLFRIYDSGQQKWIYRS